MEKEELKVNMYVRLQNDVENVVVINRIANIFDNTILTENDGSIYQGEYTKENIIKSSYNIIDLIEEGDIITTQTNEIVVPNGGNIEELKDYWNICQNPIKSILTKEQMEAMKYEVSNE